MPARSAIVRFFITLLIINTILLLPWPGWRGIYAAGFCAASNVLFGTIGDDGMVRFNAAPEADSSMDARIMLQNRSTGATGEVPLNCRIAGWLPAAMTISLVLATPLVWKRKLIALGAGLALVHGFVAFRMWIFLTHIFSGGNALAVFAPGPVMRTALDVLNEGLFDSLFGSFVGPIFIWLAVVFSLRAWPNPAKNGSTIE